MAEVLFQITTDNLETGLRGYPVGYCPTSTVDPEKGLHYVGKPVSDLIYKSPEEVIYLLYYGREGSPSEIKDFTADFRARARCSPELIEQIQKLPRQGRAMKLFSAALLLAGMYEGKEDYREDCFNLMAKIPEIPLQ